VLRNPKAHILSPLFFYIKNAVTFPTIIWCGFAEKSAFDNAHGVFCKSDML
jgi:hypothetical protein